MENLFLLPAPGLVLGDKLELAIDALAAVSFWVADFGDSLGLLSYLLDARWKDIPLVSSRVVDIL